MSDRLCTCLGGSECSKIFNTENAKKTIDISEGKKVAADCSGWRVLWAAGDLDGVFNESSNLYKHLRLASSRVKAGFDVLESLWVSSVSSS